MGTSVNKSVCTGASATWRSLDVGSAEVPGTITGKWQEGAREHLLCLQLLKNLPLF